MGDKRTIETVVFEGTTDSHFLSSVDCFLDELIIDVLLHKDSRAGHTELARVQEAGKVTLEDSRFNVCIIEDDVW